MNEQGPIADRLREHARKMRPFFDELEKVEKVVPDSETDEWKLPYSTRPNLPSRDFKLSL